MAYGTEKGGNTTGPADVAVDTVGGADYQAVKLVDGTAGSSTPIPGDANGLLVNLGANNDVTVTGTVTTGGLTDTQLRATPVPVSGTVTASGPLTDTQLRATPVPISGSVTATVASTTVTSISAGNNNIGDVDIASVPAPLSTTGGGTEATALRVTVANNSTGVLIANPTRPATATLTNVNDTNVSTTLLALNAGRIGATIWNDSTAVLYVKFGTTASATSATVKMIADAYYEFPQPCYTGRVDGIWASDQSGAARITELTA